MATMTQETTVESFKAAMGTFPSGVTIVTTCDDAWRPWGFTASAFSSLSLEPPLVLVCLAKSARCHPTFLSVDRWMIHILGGEHSEMAYRFASREADKFGGGEFSFSSGLPVLDDVPVRLECRSYATYDGGDHTILVGEVMDVTMAGGTPAFYQNRTFHSLPGGRS